jgi:hypothetical protein
LFFISQTSHDVQDQFPSNLICLRLTYAPHSCFGWGDG